jgi:hypothetical protein
MIFACLAIVHFGQVLPNLRSSPILAYLFPAETATCIDEKKKMGWATFWAMFFTNSPCTAK